MLHRYMGEAVRLPVGGLQRGHAVAPGVVVLLAGGEVVQRRQTQEIQPAHISQASGIEAMTT